MKIIKETVRNRLCIIVFLFLGTNMYIKSENFQFFTNSHIAAENMEHAFLSSPSTDSKMVDLIFYASLIIAFFLRKWYLDHKAKSTLTY